MLFRLDMSRACHTKPRNVRGLATKHREQSQQQLWVWDGAQDSQPEPARYVPAPAQRPLKGQLAASNFCLESEGAETFGEDQTAAETLEEGRAMAVVPSVPSLPGQARTGRARTLQ